MTHCTNSANLDTLVHASNMVIWWCVVLKWHMRTICNLYTCLGWLTLQDRLFVLKDNFLSIFDLWINVFIPVFLFPRYGEVSDYPFSNPPKSIFDVPGVQIGHFTQVWLIFPDLKSFHSNDVTYLLRVSVECFNFLLLVNPLHPNIGIHILHFVLYTLPKLLTRRIFLTIKSFLVGDHFLYSHDLHVWCRGDVIGRN